MATTKRGIVIGRFMPPHFGHVYLIDFALRYAGDLTVFVCTLNGEPIPGDLRYRWMTELFPSVHVVHITDEIPEASRSAEGAQDIWARTVLKHLENPPDLVFASEAYGIELARSLGATYVPVDPRRKIFPISAGMIRSDPFAFWDYIPNAVRPYYVCRVSVASADDSLVRALAARFRTVYASDYRQHLETLSYPPPALTSDTDVVAAQAASQNALLAQANRVIFLQTDVLRTVLSSTDPEVQSAYAAGAYESLIEDTRPHLVLHAGPQDDRYGIEAERRGWRVERLDVRERNPEIRAVTLVEEQLNGGGRDRVTVNAENAESYTR